MITANDFCIFYSGEDLKDKFVNKFGMAVYNNLTSANQSVYFAPVNGQGDPFNNIFDLIKLISQTRKSIIILVSQQYVDSVLTPFPFSNDDYDKVKQEYVSFRQGKASEELCPQLKALSSLGPVQKELLVVLLEAYYKKYVTNEKNVQDFISYAHIKQFEWKNANKFAVKMLYGPWAFDFDTYFELSAFKCDDQTYYQYDEKAGDAFVDSSAKKFIKEYCGLDLSKETFIMECQTDANRAFHTILQHVQHIYCDNLICDTFETENISQMLSSSRYAHFVDLLAQLSDDDARFSRASCWPIFFNDLKSHDNDELDMKALRDLEDGEHIRIGKKVNSCSACFGDLRLFNRYKKYAQENKDLLPTATKNYIEQCIAGARNMILLLRDETTKLWKEAVIFGDDPDTDIGCLNDTTLCLSTLLATGFLNKELKKDNNDMFIRRYKYIEESILALMNKGVTKDNGISWAWNDGVQPASTLATALCLDVFVKFYETCNELGLLDDCIKEKLQQCIDGILMFFKKVQHENGSFTPCESDITHESFSHTAKICNSLCTLASSSLRIRADVARSIVSKGFKFLLNKIGLDVDSAEAHADITPLFNQQKYEEFNIIDPLEYELCGELMMVTFLLKIIKNPGDYLVDTELAYCIQHRAVIVSVLVEIINRFKKERQRNYLDITGANSFVIKSRIADANGDLYPIYLLYYYDMAISDILDYLTGEGNK